MLQAFDNNSFESATKLFPEGTTAVRETLEAKYGPIAMWDTRAVNKQVLLDRLAVFTGHWGAVLEKVRENPFLLGYASREMRSDEQIVLEAVRRDGCALSHASSEMMNNEKIAMAALEKAGPIFVDAVFPVIGAEMKNNEKVVLKALDICKGSTEADKKRRIFGIASKDMQRNERVRTAAGIECWH